MAATNFLKYSSLTYSDILSQITDKITSDSRFDSFRESAIAQLLLEIFAGTTDIANYYIERRAEESFVDTAKLKSSIILLAKSLGYDIKRPVPATAKLKIKLSGDLTSKNIVANDLLQIPVYSKFVYNSKSFLLKKTYNHKFTAAEVASITNDGAAFSLELTTDDDEVYVYLIQGEQKSKVITGTTNQQVAQKFQLYKIEDKTFSNYYGSEDLDPPLTKVYVGNVKTDDTEYSIDRKSLVNWETIEGFLKGTAKKICVIRTSNDENFEIMFGDARYSDLGANVSGTYPTTTYDNIYIDYLSTLGAEANETGVIGSRLTTSISVKVNGDASKNVTNNLTYTFYSNVTGGADLETLESIKLSAPSIYYSLDRLVSKRDYVTYLKSLTSPIDIKNAIAWGEQEEYNGTTQQPIQKLFNVAMFSCLGSMYKLTGDIYEPKTNDNGLISEAVLDLDFDEESIPDQSYFNIYVKQNVVEQLSKYDTSGSYWNSYGTTITSSTALENLKNLYSGQTFEFYYGSESYLSATTQTSATSALTLSAATSLTEVATIVSDAIHGFVDARGTSATNSNYGILAFSGTNCVWDSTNSRFILSGGKTDPCYVISPGPNIVDWGSIFGGGTTHSMIPYTLGLYPNIDAQKVTYTDSQEIIADNIINVIDKLDDRSQITIRNVYISPIIQKFKLTGSIYVKQLVDKEDLHTEIKNDIYSWLDTNADFNTEIYLSNIVDKIQSYPNVVNVDVKLESDNPTLSAGQTYFFNPSSDSRIDKVAYAQEKSHIYSTIQTQLASYLGDRTTNATTDLITVWSGISLSATVKSETLSYFRNITERTFYNTLCKNIYDNLWESTAGQTRFRDTQDFLDVLSDIHKDLIPIIRYNMMDVHGNIAREDEAIVLNDIDTTRYYRGGFSMGNEIVRLTLDTNCIYKTV